MKSINSYLLLVICLLSLSSIKAQDAAIKIENEKKAAQMVAAIQAGDQNPNTFYNAACYFSLAGKSEEAFLYLEQSIRRGYTNVEHIKTDSDLIGLHKDPRWQMMLAKAQTKRNEQQSAFFNKKEFWESPAFKTAYKENLSEDEKIAGLSKFWSEAKYNFANFDLIPNVNWDTAYFEYLPRVKQTKSTLEYYMLLREFSAKLRDGHTNVFAPTELREEISARPPIRTRLIEDKIIIIGIYDDSLKQSGLEVGQEITELDGMPVKQYAEKYVMPYQSVSTNQDMEVRMYDYELLRGSIKKPVELTLRDKNGKVFKQSLRREGYEERIKKFPQLKSFEFKLLPGNIAYVALNEFGSDEAAKGFEAAFDEIAKSDALIIDVRENGGGSSGVGYRVLSTLTDKSFKGSKWETRQYRPAFRPWERPLDYYGGEAYDIAPNGKKLYTKPVIVLTSPRTFSAAEDFGVAYIQMKRGLIIGEPTGGSTGQPLFFTLPGGGSARVCSKRDRFADGREFVGAGIQPDKLVRQTIVDFRAGKDTVLEAALNELKK